MLKPPSFFFVLTVLLLNNLQASWCWIARQEALGSRGLFRYATTDSWRLLSVLKDDNEREKANTAKDVSLDTLYDTMGEELAAREALLRGTENSFGLIWEQKVLPDAIDGCGEDCDEACDIPDEYKNKRTEKINVLEYLGIKRAPPLQVNHSVLDWQ